MKKILYEYQIFEAQYNYEFVANRKSCRLFIRLSPIKPFVKHLFNQIDKSIESIVRSSISKKRNKLQIKPSDQRKKLLIDCSCAYKIDLNTGIQRVVNNIVKYMNEYAKEKNIELVTVSLEDGFITKVNLEHKKVFSSKRQSVFMKIIQKLQWYILLYRHPVTVCEKDILLMLDSVWGVDVLQSVEYAKQRNAKIIGVCYDLIPIFHPQFCENSLVETFHEYLDKTLLYFDGYIAISQTVMETLQSYIKSKDVELSKYTFDYFQLGTGFKANTCVVPKVRSELSQLYKDMPSVYLAVSTIEPRKNHRYLLTTFEGLWKNNVDATLLIVGRVGWKMENLIEQIVGHPEYQKRLWLFHDLDDNELNYCYNNSKALVFPSFVEGFGLPIIESLQNGLPVLASDIPIHREVGKGVIDYFDISNPISLMNKIQAIEKNELSLKKVDEKNIHIYTWEESAKELMNKILLSDKCLEERETNES